MIRELRADIYTDEEGVERFRGSDMRVARDRLGNIVETSDQVYYFYDGQPRIGKITDMNGWADEYWIDGNFTLGPSQVVRIIPEDD